MTYRILVTDEIDADGVALLTSEPEFVVDVLPTLPAAELLERSERRRVRGPERDRITASSFAARAGCGRGTRRRRRGTSRSTRDLARRGGDQRAGRNTVAVASCFFGALIGCCATCRTPPLHARRQVGLSKLSARRSRGAARDRRGGPHRERVATRRWRSDDVAATIRNVGDESVPRAAHPPHRHAGRGAGTRRRASPCTRPHRRDARHDRKRELGRQKSGASSEPRAGRHHRGDALIQSLESVRLNGAIIDAFSKESARADQSAAPAPHTSYPHLWARATAERSATVAVDACAACAALLHGELSRSINVACGGYGLLEELMNGLQSWCGRARSRAFPPRRRGVEDGAGCSSLRGGTVSAPRRLPGSRRIGRDAEATIDVRRST